MVRNSLFNFRSIKFAMIDLLSSFDFLFIPDVSYKQKTDNQRYRGKRWFRPKEVVDFDPMTLIHTDAAEYRCFSCNTKQHCIFRECTGNFFIGRCKNCHKAPGFNNGIGGEPGNEIGKHGTYYKQAEGLISMKNPEYFGNKDKTGSIVFGWDLKMAEVCLIRAESIVPV